MEKEQLPLSQNTETTPRFATCSIESCTAANVRGRSCALCEKHLCAVHIQPRHHGCATEANVCMSVIVLFLIADRILSLMKKHGKWAFSEILMLS